MARFPTIEIDADRALLASRVLAGIGASLALAAAAVDFTPAASLAAPLLAVAMVLVGLAGFALGARAVEKATRPRTRRALQSALLDARFRRNMRLSAYSLGMYAIFLCLAILGLGSLLAALGIFGDFTLGASIIGAHLEVLLAVATIAIAGATPFAAHIPVTAPLSNLRRNGSVAAAAVLLAGLVVGNIGVATSLLPAFTGAAAFLVAAVALFVLVHWNARLPDLADVLEWLETDERVRKSDLPKAIVMVFSAVATASLLGAFAAGSGLLPQDTGDILLGVGAFAIVLASFGVGIQPVEARFEYGAAAIEHAHRKRVLILRTLSYGLAGVAAVLVLLALLTLLGTLLRIAAFLGLAESFVAGHQAWLALALLPLVAVVVTRVFVKSDRRYTDTARALSSLLAAGSVVLIALGVLMGTRTVTGELVTDTSVTLLFAAAVVVLTFFVRTRALLPSLFELLKEEAKKADTAHADEDLKISIQRRMLWTYVLSGFFVLAFVGFVAASSFGLLDMGGSGPARDAVYLVWIIAALFVLVAVALRYFQNLRIETKAVVAEEEIGKRRLTNEEFQRYLILGTSAAFAVLFVVLGMLTFAGKMTSVGPIALTPNHGTDFLVFAILTGLGPYGFYHNRELKRIQAIDQKFPEFLRDLAESQRSGMTLTEAVVTASKGTYGALTWDIRKMAAQIEWGVSFTESLKRFAKRVRTPLIERTVALVVQASEAGGNVVDILTAAADDSREIQVILKERKSAMSIYTMIIYIAFLVFIGVIAILNAQFIPEVSKAVRSADGVTVGGMTFKAFDEAEFKMLFFHAAVVQGFGGGLVAGVMEGGKPVSGLKHAFVMVALAYVLFRFVIGG